MWEIPLLVIRLCVIALFGASSDTEGLPMRRISDATDTGRNRLARAGSLRDTILHPGCRRALKAGGAMIASLAHVNGGEPKIILAMQKVCHSMAEHGALLSLAPALAVASATRDSACGSGLQPRSAAPKSDGVVVAIEHRSHVSGGMCPFRSLFEQRGRRSGSASHNSGARRRVHAPIQAIPSAAINRHRARRSSTPRRWWRATSRR